MQSYNLQLPQRIVPVILGVAVANAAPAAEWTTSAAVAPAVTYTDNVCLSQDNEKGEWVGLLTPDVAIKGNGRRANVDLKASVELNTLTDSKLENLGCNPSGFGSREQFSPKLMGRANSVLVDDWLFIDANAQADQNETTSAFSGGGDSLNRTGNTNTFYRYGVSPYISHRFKDTAKLLLRYDWDEQYNTEDVVGDSTKTAWLATLGNKHALTPLFWGIEGSYIKVEYSDRFDRPRNDNELKSAKFRLGYQFNRAWQINGFYGQEWNEFDTTRSGDQDGDYWDAGLRWTPTARTTVEAGTGNRFFGNTPRMSISHRHKRSEFNASYLKAITFDRDIRTAGNTSGSVDNSGVLSDGPILDERFTLGYSYNGRRGGLNVRGSHSEQTRAEDGEKSTFKNIAVSINRSLSRKFSVTGSVSWDEDEPRVALGGISTQSETWRTSLQAQRQLTQSSSLSLNYQYTDRQSDRALDEYQENRVTATLKIDL